MHENSDVATITQIMEVIVRMTKHRSLTEDGFHFLYLSGQAID